MKKKTVVSVMTVAMLFAISLFFVGGTYARYVSDFTGEGKVDIAAWKVALTEGNGGAGTKLNLSLKPDDAEGYVVDGKIAPSYTASGVAEVTLDGTEVAVDVLAYIEEDALETALTSAGITTPAEDFTLKVTAEAKNEESFTLEAGGDGSKTKPFVIKLPDNAKFDANDVLKITVSLEWNNKADASSTQNTTDGVASASETKTLTIPLTLSVTQHVKDGSVYSPAP